jgi:hypothetical protein
VARRQIRPEAGVYFCILEERREQSLHSVCSTIMPLWTNKNRGCLTKELLVSLSKAWHVLWSVLRILQNDPPSSTQMDGPCVNSVECTLYSMTALVRCFLRQSGILCCSILPKYEKESEILRHPTRWPSTFSPGLTSRSSASRRVLFLFDIVLQVCII